MANSFNTCDTPVFDALGTAQTITALKTFSLTPVIPDVIRATAASLESIPRNVRLDTAVTLNTGLESLYGFKIPANQVVSSITLVTGATILGGTPTHQWVSLRNSSRQSLAFSGDDGVTAWGAQTAKTFYISRSVTDAAITSGQATLTSATAAFTSADNGKQVTVMGAGAAGVPLGTSAARVTMTFVNTTTATLSANAGTTIASGGTAYIATPYTNGAADVFDYVGVMLASSGAMPNFYGVSDTNTAVKILAPVLSGQDGTNTGLTTPASAPGTSAALTAWAQYPYIQIA